ncbi:hypothetical protein SLA2020_199460 [Shorea laevis]
MSNLAIQFHLLLFFSIPIALTTARLGKLEVRSNKNVAMFVFGDSVFDPGNNNYIDTSISGKANFPPYGETFFRYPTGRVCDGRILPDFAAAYVGLPYWRPYLDPDNHNFVVGANFGSAGGAVLVETNPYTINLEQQVFYMKKVASLLKEELGDENASELLKGAIYLSSSGGVDYMAFSSSTSDPTEAEMEAYVKIVIGNITNAVKDIYALGGRKFAFQNVGPLGCQPENKQSYNTSGCVELLQTLASMHNDVLNTVAEELASELPGFKYLIFDYFTTVMERTENPTKYGFKEGDIACCGSGTHRADGCGYLTVAYELCSNPNEYVFFDGGHPTEAANIQLTELLWNGTTNVTWPINLSQLVELDSTDVKISTENVDILIDQRVAPGRVSKANV